MHEPYSLQFVCRFCLTVPGRLEGPHDFWLWGGGCVVCGRIQIGTQGLFCANFSSSRGGFPACRQSWCAECYTSLVLGDKFHVEEPQDEGGFVWNKRGDELRYLVARSGDHLQCPFQCDLCIFRTLKGEDSVGRRISDCMLKRCIRRINLDALWARDPKTVYKERCHTRSNQFELNDRLDPAVPCSARSISF
jgi:hypothetical protein